MTDQWARCRQVVGSGYPPMAVDSWWGVVVLEKIASIQIDCVGQGLPHMVSIIIAVKSVCSKSKKDNH